MFDLLSVWHVLDLCECSFESGKPSGVFLLLEPRWNCWWCYPLKKSCPRSCIRKLDQETSRRDFVVPGPIAAAPMTGLQYYHVLSSMCTPSCLYNHLPNKTTVRVLKYTIITAIIITVVIIIIIITIIIITSNVIIHRNSHVEANKYWPKTIQEKSKGAGLNSVNLKAIEPATIQLELYNTIGYIIS